jgi:hypothetical protein
LYDILRDALVGKEKLFEALVVNLKRQISASLVTTGT